MDLARLDDFVPLVDPTALPRVISLDDARARGYTRAAIEHLLRTGRWRRILPRVYLASDTLTYADRVRAALAYVGPDGLLSAAAALTDQHLRAVPQPDSLLVLAPRRVTVRSRGWVRVRRCANMPARALLPGPRRVTPDRAVADLALELDRLDDVRTLVAEAVRRGVCSVDELAARYRAGPRQHSAHLRRAIDDVGRGAWSAPEARAATLLRRAHVPPFEQNARIDLPDGRHLVVDFLWRGLRAVLEIDSDTHHALTGDADRTADRHLVLETLGYSTIHRTPRYVLHEPTAFVATTERWLAARAARIA